MLIKNEAPFLIYSQPYALRIEQVENQQMIFAWTVQFPRNKPTTNRIYKPPYFLLVALRK